MFCLTDYPIRGYKIDKFQWSFFFFFHIYIFFCFAVGMGNL